VALGAAAPKAAPSPATHPCTPLQVDPEELQLRKQALLAAMHEHRMVRKLPS
jgi:hypothetical protein